MSKPYTEQDLSDLFDREMNWRRRELADLKSAIKLADQYSRRVLLRAFVTMTYAHWEGYVKYCAEKYFQYFTIRKQPFSRFERQFYTNSFLVRLDALYHTRTNVERKSMLIDEIIEGGGKRFTYISSELVDTQSNLSTDVIKDICLVCSIESDHFEYKRSFIDLILLKRRNAIAHGQQEFVDEKDVDSILESALGLMKHFSDLLENKIYSKSYLAA